ncbi:MAG: hypothetical protein ACFBRM_15250 [Pikeienuella sp.]
MRYAMIGWGSLVWDLDDLAPKVRGVWARGAGPVLPLEFSRVSKKRHGALTAALDTEYGQPARTSVIEAAARSLEEATADLAARERAPIGLIGAVCTIRGAAHGAKAPVVEHIAAWCAQTGWTGAVWTDLPANFHEATGAPFSVARGEAYLRALSEPSLAEAHRYITRAPPETDTALRRRLSADPWWQALGKRLG